MPLPSQHPVSLKVAETTPGAPHDFAAIDGMSAGLATAYAKMVHGPLMDDIKRWARKLTRQAKKAMPGRPLGRQRP